MLLLIGLTLFTTRLFLFTYIYHFTADSGSDYALDQTFVVSSIGDITVSGSLVIFDDNDNEDTEVFTIVIESCTNRCNPGLMNSLIVNIEDDDSM